MEDSAPTHHVVVARNGQLRIAIPVHALRKVVATPGVTPLPGAPAIIAGLINLHGFPLLIFDPARQAADAPRQPALDTSIAVVETDRRTFGLLCESLDGVVDLPDTAWQSLEELMPGIGLLAACTSGDAELLVMRDPDDWLSASQEIELQLALDRYSSRASTGAPTPAGP